MEEEPPVFTMNLNYQAKLKELLRNLTATESKLFSDAARESIKILDSDSGPEFVRVYLQSSHKLIEISTAWETHKGKFGFWHILDLISAILKHCKDDANLDKFARGLLEERMGELVKELNSREGKKQNAVLLLLGSIVRRNSHLAWEVAKVFDFKLPVFRKLGEVRLRDRESGEGVKRKSYSTRKAFVGFAMAFIEIGHPRLLRGILQQKDMYSGVLRGLGNDDEETVVYVLSVLRDRVLVPESLVPPGLRSVLFGSVTLEQLVLISGREDFTDGAELAYNVLLLVCTDPENGLMPDLERQPSPLRGNLKRLLDLMKKLKATEVEYHKDLLQAIVKGRPLFGSAYLDEFPYNLEDPSSNNWFAAISLAADVVFSVREGLSSGILDKSTGFEDPRMQHILKCIGPRPFTKLIMNKGLLHSETLVKHGTLRLVLEALKLLDLLLCSVDRSSQSKGQIKHDWEVLKAEIQDGVRMSLPDPQVLLSLLSPLNNHLKSFKSAIKRKAETEDSSINGGIASKRRKSNIENDDTDIVVVGVCSFPELDMPTNGVAELGSDHQEEDNVGDIVKDIGDIWGLRQSSIMNADIKDRDTYFYSKLLDTLAIYYRTMPMAIEGLFDLFKLIPSDSLSMPTILLHSLLNLLVEHVNHSSGGMSAIRAQTQIYKHLPQFVALLLYSPVREIKEQAYILAKEAMLSTGAFDNNPRDISTWFLFIPGYNDFNIYDEDLEVGIFQQLSAVVVSFLSDAVVTTGNNLYKYMELLMNYIYDEEVGTGQSHEVSPLVVCVLEKCLRLLSSESGSFTLPQKSLISLYVCNTIKYLLDTQVYAGRLSFLIDHLLSEKLENYNDSVNRCPCEWRPLKSLLYFARKLLNREPYGVYANAVGLARSSSSDSLVNIVSDIKKVLREEDNVELVGLAVGFSYSLVCASHTEIFSNFSSILCISDELQKVPLSVLASILFLETSHLTHITTLWPENLLCGVEKVGRIEYKEEDIFDEFDFNSKETVSTAFANYLKMAPFCVIFSLTVLNTNMRFLEQSALQKLLLDKLTGLPSDHLITSLRNILFWMYHVRSSLGFRSLDELEMISRLCFGLTEHLLTQLSVQDLDTVSPGHLGNPLPHYAIEMADIILNHPVVTALVESPLLAHKEFRDSVFKENLETLVESVKRGVHALDRYILGMLKTVSELLIPMCKDKSSEKALNGYKRISGALKALVQKLVLTFRSNFDACIRSGDFKLLVPTFHALHTLIHFISPFELLELVNWLLSRIDYRDVAFNLKSKENALFICLHLAGISFDVLSANIWQAPGESYSFLDGTAEMSCDASLFERVYFQVLEITNYLRLDMSDVSLLKAVKVVRLRKNSQKPHLASVVVLSKVIASAPVNIVSHCLNKVNKTKAELLHRIAEISPLHLSAFGHMFAEILNKSSCPKASLVQEATVCSYSEEELVMLLPTVYLYLNSTISRFVGEHCEPFKSINLVYGQMLLSGFRNWNSFVSGNICEVELDETMPTSTEEFLDHFSDSLLGKAALMVQNYLALSERSMNFESRLSLFSSLCPDDIARDDIFGYEISGARLYSLRQTSEFVNKIVAKSNFCRMLLLLDRNQLQSQLGSNGDRMVPQEVNSEAEKLRIRLLRVLISSWRSVVKLFPEIVHDSEKIEEKSLLIFRSLEIFLMQNILELTTKLHDCLVKLSSLPFIERLVKSFLRYRFGDHATLKMLQTVLTSLSDGNISCASLIQLVLGHSQFVQSIELASKTVGSTQFGLMFTPLPSILRSLVIPHADVNTQDGKNNTLSVQQHLNLLELVKLIRVLFCIYVQQKNANFGEDIGIKSRELIYLLLSSYGATRSDIDIEIYGLIQEIETNDRSSAGAVAQMDYLWGIASLKARKDCELGNDVDSLDSQKIEAIEEHRKIQFRKNFPVDPKLCAQTVLYFPYFNYVNDGSLAMHQRYNSTVMQEACCTTVDKMQTYDPVFILRFSIHCLSMSYMEPIEFASLGLLAVTFVSVSSPDDDVRKLGYEVLAKFKSTLEICRKNKDVKRLLLLLSYLQNGVQEPWQRIPSFITVFLAEVSLVLLNPSHEHYSSISMHLMNSPGVNLKTIPLFQKLFCSTSVNFKADRLWMLRLLYVGLSSEDDAQIYMKNNVFDMLISFYSSPLSDNDSKELIIQILKKAVQFHKTVCFLVERCGLIIWLSSIISSLYGGESQDRTKFTFRVLPIVLEVVKSITSTRAIVEWLEKHALEQLADLSSHLYRLIVGGIELLMEQTSLCTPILQILILMLKLSQKRKLHQPHFTMSFEGLYNLYEAVQVCSKTSCHETMVLGLEVILMSSPPVTILQTEQGKLSNFLRWAVTTAIWSKSREVQPEDSDDCLIAASWTKSTEESLISKLLRWLTASVILGKIPCNSNRQKSCSSTEEVVLHSLKSLLECQEDTGNGGEDILASSIFYLLQLMGSRHNLLPSVVPALCLLLLGGSTSESLDGLKSSLSLFCSIIRSPPEANPAWRWSFDEPWRDLSSEVNDVEKLEEIHACEKLLVVASHTFLKKSLSGSQVASLDVKELSVYDWEKSVFEQSK